MKQCKKCDTSKSLDNFYNHPEMSDGHLNICKECKRASSRSSWSLSRGPSEGSPNTLPGGVNLSDIKWIPGLEGGYAVTKHGDVYSYTKNWNTGCGAKKMSKSKSNCGYYEVGLSVNGGRTDVLVHRAILFTFEGPPKNNEESRHLNGDKLDNRIENLQWGTSSQNWEDTKKHGNALLGSERPGSKLTPEDVYKIRRRREETGDSYSHISEDYPVSKDCIRLVAIGKNWKHVCGPIQEVERSND